MKFTGHCSIGFLMVALASLTSAQVCPACPIGSFCRLVQECLRCPARQSCVTCVPPGVDDVCNINGYLRAVLVGNPDFARSLQERQCNVFSPCPLNTACAPDGSGFSGTCCYGRPLPGQPPRTSDTICGPNRCFPFCPPATSCQRVVLCPFAPPCVEELQCRPSFSPLSFEDTDFLE